MWVRSPLGAHVEPAQYFVSVTAHGVSMAYALTFFIMGFDCFVAS
jgi:cytochrome c oxidase subunit 1